MAKFDLKTFNPEAFGKYIQTVPKLKRNELIRSKALKGNTEIRNAFSNQTGVYYAVLPMYGLLGGEPDNYDGNTDINADTTDTYDRGVIVVGRAKGWVEKDFSEDITGGAGFMSNVARQVSSYWEDVDQDTLLAVLDGAFAMTGNAGNTGFVTNHTLDLSTETGDAAFANATTLNNAIQKASGDNKSKFTLAIMHSTVATNLENLNLITYLKYTDENGIERDLGIGTWNGRVVLIDDGMPVDSSGADPLYTTYLLGEGAFDFEDVGVEEPYEMDRDPAKNGGQTTLYTRQRKVFAPYGISFTKDSVASLSPTLTELKNGANWELVHNGGSGGAKKYFDHKAIPIARIITKG